jgi:hypothetical protein
MNLEYLKVCADASAGICQAYKRLHRIYGADYTPFAVQSLFLSGLTLLHCTWLAPQSCLAVIGAISDCNLMLYAIAERYPPTHKYRDVFDRIKTNVIDAIAKGGHEATRTAGILDNEVTEQCRALDESLISTVRTDYLQIINDLAKDRRRIAAEKTVDLSTWQLKSLDFVRDNDQVLHFDLSILSSPMMDDSLGYAHGGFIDSASMDNIQQLTDWDLAIDDR